MAQFNQSESTWQENRDRWSKVWFEKFCRFHKRKPQPPWVFTADDAIAYLRDHVRRKTPAWKRLKIIESLICYRQDALSTERAYVTDVRALMRDRGLTCQANFDSIIAADVEAHLTLSLRR